MTKNNWWQWCDQLSIICQCHKPKLAKKCDSDKSFSHSFSRKKALSKVYTGIGKILYFIKFNKDISGSWKGVHYMTVPAANKLNQHPNKKGHDKLFWFRCNTIVCKPGSGKRPEPWGDATLNLSRCQCYDHCHRPIVNRKNQNSRVPAPLAGKPTLPPDSNRLATKC